MKKIVLIFASIYCWFTGTTIYANDIGMNETNITRADRIEWRYKIIDGVLYKRLYNYSKDEWIGDWVLA